MPAASRALRIDFSGDAKAVKAVVEAWRLAYGHTVNPVFATEVSAIDPLPHQRIAVYEKMLPQERLRFLLADDAGAGKTIMSGLLIREMLSRQRVRRVLIVPPAGLVGNWQRELKELFQLNAAIVSGKDMNAGNPFAASENIIITSIDTMREEKARRRLREPETIAFDLVIFDEAHKLTCDQGKNFREAKSLRYRLAEMLAGANEDAPPQWRLAWTPPHLLLLSATPHMGKDYPYFALWRLLDAKIFSSPQALGNAPKELKEKYFIRRAKEEMTTLDGRPLYPARISDTLGYSLSGGENGERRLYDETTEYLRRIYNKALSVNPAAASLALSVFQRRLSSSTYALKRSLERRLAKIGDLLRKISAGLLDERQLAKSAAKTAPDVFSDKTADEERPGENGLEENEANEAEIVENILATTRADLLMEQERLDSLLKLAGAVMASGRESKFESLLGIVRDPRFAREKILIFTEHRDTLDFLARKLAAQGFAGRVACIHGGMDYRERQEAIENFRKPLAQNGAQYMICTDAAAEGVNLQFCWIMINYDIPWNPARLEQRMGRVHRYGQKHDPVFLINLVATSTREGKVLATLLEKLEKIRAALSSDKVYDCIGRVFSGVSIKRYMERALLAVRENDLDSLTKELAGEITAEQVAAAFAREENLYGRGGDVAARLPQLRQQAREEECHRLLPGFMENFMEQALPLLQTELRPAEQSGLWRPVFSRSPASQKLKAILDQESENLLAFSPNKQSQAHWTHPNDIFFAAACGELRKRYARDALGGGIFVDAEAAESSIIHVARYSILRQGREIWRLGAVCQTASGLEQTGLEEFLRIRPRLRELIPADAQLLARDMAANAQKAHLWFLDKAREEARAEAENLARDLPERLKHLAWGFAYRDMELSEQRALLSRKKRAGHDVEAELAALKKRAGHLAAQKAEMEARLMGEAGNTAPGRVEFIARALILPEDVGQSGPETDASRADIELLAMKICREHEERFGRAFYVHTPELARLQHLPPRCGFDLLSLRPLPDGGVERRCIEVKGSRTGAYVEMTENEWCRAANLGDQYWLYIVSGLESGAPRLWRAQNPVKNILLKNMRANLSRRRVKIADAQAVAEPD